MRSTRYAAYAAAGLLIAAAAACSSTSTSSTAGSPPAGIASNAQGVANVPGADATTMLIKAGVPVNGNAAQQIAFAYSMKTKANREALAQRLEIPVATAHDPNNRKDFEGALLKTFEDSITSGAIKTHTGRVATFNTAAAYVTLYQA